MNNSPNDSSNDVNDTDHTNGPERSEPEGTPTASPDASRQVCPECGAANAPEGVECIACGEILPVGANPLAEEAPEVPDDKAAGASTSTVYFVTGAVVLVIAAVAFFLSADFQGPPEGATSAQLPAGHPQVPGAGGAAPGTSPELQKRIDSVEARLEANPDNPQLHLELANLLYDVNRHEEAVRHYGTYLQSNPEDVDARTDMATSIASMGGLELATEHLHEVISTDPDHQKAMFNLAVIYYHQQKRDSVLYYLERVVAIDSTSPQGHTAQKILEGGGEM